MDICIKNGNVQLMEKSVITVKDQIILLKCARRKIHAVGENFGSSDTETEYDQYFVQSMECTSDKEKKCEKKLEVKMDPGAQVSVLPHKVYNRLSRSLLDHKVQPVLGLQTCLEPKLIKQMYTVSSGIDNDDPNKLLKDYKVFEDLGCRPDEYNIS